MYGMVWYGMYGMYVWYVWYGMYGMHKALKHNLDGSGTWKPCSINTTC